MKTNKMEEIEYQTGAELTIMAHSKILTTSVGGFGQLASNIYVFTSTKLMILKSYSCS